MSDDTIDREMRDLAETLARTAPGLDFTLASLKALEKLAKKKPPSPAHTRACGAYLGETMRRQAPEQLRWVSFASAAKANATIGKLPPGPDLDALLAAGETFWFPLSKVEKFQKNGSTDSLGPFANVALRAVVGPTPADDEAERERRAEAGSVVDAAMRAFRKEETAASMAALQRALFGEIPRREMRATFARLGLETRPFFRFLGVPAEGRGYQRRDHGRAAASILRELVVLEAAPREPTLAEARTFLKSPSKDARRNAAEVLAYCDLTAGGTDVFLELATSKDRETVSGALAGLWSTTSDWRMGYAAPKITMAPLAPRLRALLAPKSPHLGLVLTIVRTWAWHRPQRADLAHLADALIPLLDHPKRDTARNASEILTTYLWAIAHGHAPRDPAVEKLDAREDGFGANVLAKIRALP